MKHPGKPVASVMPGKVGILTIRTVKSSNNFSQLKTPLSTSRFIEVSLSSSSQKLIARKMNGCIKACIQIQIPTKKPR